MGLGVNRIGVPLRRTLFEGKVLAMVKTPKIVKVPRPRSIERAFVVTSGGLLSRRSGTSANRQASRTHNPNRSNERSAVHGSSYTGSS